MRSTSDVMQAMGSDGDGATTQALLPREWPSAPRPRPRRGSAAAVVVAPLGGRPSGSPRHSVLSWVVAGPSWVGGDGGSGGRDDADLLPPSELWWFGMRRQGPPFASPIGGGASGDGGTSLFE